MAHMLTTVDNPYDPFTEYDDWFQFDRSSGYNTPGFLARVTVGSHDLSDADQLVAIETAIQEIVKQNVLGIYRIAEGSDE
jgi:hypothetical protein